jgi:hypothetical protein
MKKTGLHEIKRMVEAGIDLVKTKQGDAKLIVVGGGSIILEGDLAGAKELIRPQYFEVANAIGAAVGRLSHILGQRCRLD